MAGRWLFFDCYLGDGQSATPNFAPHFAGVLDVVRATEESIPMDWSAWSGVVISGSAASVLSLEPWSQGMLHGLRRAMAARVPVLGVCYGHQLLALAAGGDDAVGLAPTPEVGFIDIEVVRPDPLFDGLGERFQTFVTHRDEARLHPTLEPLAGSAGCDLQAFRVKDKPAWGVQFHTEMGPDEAERILRWRAELHPELGLDPDAALADFPDSKPLAERLFRNFRRLTG